MERLYKLVLATTAVLLAYSFVPCASAQDYCSLRVHVSAPNGRVLYRVLVTVNETNGRTLKKWQTPNKDAQFCDLGITPVTVTVGLQGCNPIVIGDLRLFWREPYVLKVIYDMQHCMRESPPPPKPVCEILFRVRTQTGDWIKNASLQLSDDIRSNLPTDSDGRALVVADINEQIDGTATAPGFLQKAFSAKCSSTGGQEEIVQLEKRRVAAP